MYGFVDFDGANVRINAHTAIMFSAVKIFKGFCIEKMSNYAASIGDALAQYSVMLIAGENEYMHAGCLHTENLHGALSNRIKKSALFPFFVVKKYERRDSRE